MLEILGVLCCLPFIDDLEQYPDGKSVIVQMDNNGNIQQLTYPDATTVAYGYDQLDRPTSVAGYGATAAVSYTP